MVLLFCIIIILNLYLKTKLIQGLYTFLFRLIILYNINLNIKHLKINKFYGIQIAIMYFVMVLSYNLWEEISSIKRIKKVTKIS